MSDFYAIDFARLLFTSRDIKITVYVAESNDELILNVTISSEEKNCIREVFVSYSR